MMATDKETLVVSLTEVGLSDVGLVGGKNASLGELLRDLKSQGIRVPDGFALTVNAYRRHLEVNRLQEKISEILKGLDVKSVADLSERARRIRHLILSAPLPEEIGDQIVKAYDRLCEGAGECGCIAGVAVRSSATAEDLPEASFAGQQETYLNVRGHIQLIDSCKRCFASLFTDRAISYRANLGIGSFDVALSVGVQRMVRSDLASAGVMFSLDTETGFRDVVLINSSFGLGETIVQGTVNPDEFLVFKTTLKQGYRPILERRLGSKEFKLVYDIGGEKTTKVVPIPPEERRKFSLTDDEVLELSRWAMAIETHYSQKYGRSIPMDIEWAKDGLTGDLYIVQARPETVQSQKKLKEFETYTLKKRGRVLCQGRSVGNKIGRGRARVIREIQDLNSLQDGEILVTEKTDPDWEPVLKRAAGVVTDQGGRTCHAAIVSRELGIPAIVGTGEASRLLKTGQEITVSCAEGETGFIYEGLQDFAIEHIDVSKIPRPGIKVMMNVANPEEALRLSFIPNDGVGLAREEFIVNHFVRVHPMALVRFDKLESLEDKRKILEITTGYSDKTQYFVDRLAEGIGLLAAAFFPKDVILRFSDFKTNEYAHLIGGKAFEPREENPMLGFRGASRYYDERYREGFALECRAVKKARDEMGLTNLKLMIPFCRTVDEGKRVLAEMERNGLKRGENGLEVYVMCEIPSNVILAHEFAEIFDGFSIGSNDLTQLVLGVDRDSDLVAHLFDERNEAVTQMISKAIQTAKTHGRKIGICGQAPSDYPEFTEFLVREGIDSISLNPDSVLKTTQLIVNVENAIKSQSPSETYAHLKTERQLELNETRPPH